MTATIPIGLRGPEDTAAEIEAGISLLSGRGSSRSSVERRAAVFDISCLMLRCRG
jgi:hypothetical protein